MFNIHSTHSNRIHLETAKTNNKSDHQFVALEVSTHVRGKERVASLNALMRNRFHPLHLLRPAFKLRHGLSSRLSREDLAGRLVASRPKRSNPPGRRRVVFPGMQRRVQATEEFLINAIHLAVGPSHQQTVEVSWNHPELLMNENCPWSMAWELKGLGVVQELYVTSCGILNQSACSCQVSPQSHLSIYTEEKLP